MKPSDDPFVPLAEMPLADDSFAALQQRPVSPSPVLLPVPAIARLHGFDLLEIPQVGAIAACPGRVIAARSTVALRRVMVGREVLVLFEQGDVEQPIIIGVIEPQALQDQAATPSLAVQLHADGERHLIEAKREIVLRCGEASITLTRAGKVIIRGAYILSRSSGYNKIKGAAIDIN